MVNLRPYQVDAVERVRQAMAGGRRRVCLVLPTGGGKTVVASEFVRRTIGAGRRVLFIAPRAELVDQAAATFLRAGMKVGVSCASASTPPNPFALVQVASVQTLLARNARPAADMIVVDECVTGDTEVGGRRARDISVGDLVNSWDDKSVTPRRVVRVFRNRVHSLRTIYVGDTSITCTDAHPLWVAGRGYVYASEVRHGDLCRVRMSDAASQGLATAPASAHMLGSVQGRSVFSNDEEHEQRARSPGVALDEDVEKQPDAVAGDSVSDGEDSSLDRPQAQVSGWEWEGAHGSAVDASFGARERVETGEGRADREGFRSGELGLDRSSSRGIEDSSRSGWRLPLIDDRESARSTEGPATRLARVDRVEVHEPGSDGTFGGRCPDGLVYNFEVEDEHNFFANGILTHNCHHAVADECNALLGAYRDALVVGLTATPERGDGRGLGDVFDGLVVGATVRELTDLGHLVPCEILRPAKPLQPGQLAQSPVDAYLEHARGRRTVVFARSIELANEYANAFTARGVRAASLSISTPWAERRLIVGALRRGGLDVVCNVMVLTEGFDAPEVSCVILARGCGSQGLYIQIVGRALRPAPGKTDALLLDLRGVSHEHGRPEDDREYSLDGRGMTLRDPNSYCSVCGALRVPPDACPACGFAPSRDESGKTDEVTGEKLSKFARMREGDDESKKAERLGRWLRDAAAKGHKPGAALHKYSAVYGAFPSPGIKQAAYRFAKGAA